MSLFEKFRPHLPKAVAAAIGVGVGAAVTALGFNPDIGTILGQLIGGWLGSGG